MSSLSGTFLSKSRVNVLSQAFCNTWACVCVLTWLQSTASPHHRPVNYLLKSAGAREKQRWTRTPSPWDWLRKFQNREERWKVTRVAHDVPKLSTALESRARTLCVHKTSQRLIFKENTPPPTQKPTSKFCLQRIRKWSRLFLKHTFKGYQKISEPGP